MVEILIITVLVLWSCIIVFKKVMPKTANATFSSISDFCQRKGWQSLAKLFAPKMAAGCGGSCSCGSESKDDTQQEVKAVKWK